MVCSTRPRLVPADLLAPTLEAANDLFCPVVRGWHFRWVAWQAVGLPAVMQVLNDLLEPSRRCVLLIARPIPW
ncbi:MAG: hypothetical protein CYG59_08715 [Chloroflexi bacterium]|nr:MAG: hypothetical protein CYG59_08715 [Chloroflexota bacterium]